MKLIIEQPDGSKRRAGSCMSGTAYGACIMRLGAGSGSGSSWSGPTMRLALRQRYEGEALVDAVIRALAQHWRLT